MVECREFSAEQKEQAMQWTWERMEEGFFVCLRRR
jgi:hypothetical protein